MAESPASNDPPAIDNAELQRAFSEIGEKSAKVALEFLATQPHTHMLRDIDELGIGKAFSELGSRWMANPSLLAEHTARAWEEQLRLWNTSLARFLGEPADPVRAPARGDNRFRAEAWESNFVFDYIKQSYLIAAEHIQRSVDAVQDLSPEDARKVRFFTRQYVDALAPTNFVLTNPEVLKTTLDTRGRNLLDGLKHLLEDLDRGDGKLAIRPTSRPVSWGAMWPPPRARWCSRTISCSCCSSSPPRPRWTGRRCSSCRPGSTSTTSSICEKRTASSSGPWTRASRCS
jgi:hypothetical protein